MCVGVCVYVCVCLCVRVRAHNTLARGGVGLFLVCHKIAAVYFEHVQGHSGNPWYEFADRICGSILVSTSFAIGNVVCFVPDISLRPVQHWFHDVHDFRKMDWAFLKFLPLNERNQFPRSDAGGNRFAIGEFDLLKQYCLPATDLAAYLDGDPDTRETGHDTEEAKTLIHPWLVMQCNSQGMATATTQTAYEEQICKRGYMIACFQEMRGTETKKHTRKFYQTSL